MVKRFKQFIGRHKKIAPVIFFTVGFVWDSFTLQRIDRLYENMILCLYLISLSLLLYLYNLADDGKWKNTFLEKYEEYFPLAIQFFLGGLCGAYVIFYSRSVSLTKTVAFFIILVFLLFANEIFKKRISNKYLQFGAYFFVSFTFFTFFIPVLLNVMNTLTFILSGLIGLILSLALIGFIYFKSPTTRAEINGFNITSLILSLYLFINIFYYFNLIPPVPLALKEGFVAHDVQKLNESFLVSYEKTPWYKFWSGHNTTFARQPNDSIYVFTSIFAPANLEKNVYHHWQWYNPENEKWQTTDKISYRITGGRDGGYRGYTFKENIQSGRWRVDVVTEEGLILGIIKFRVPEYDEMSQRDLVQEKFY